MKNDGMNNPAQTAERIGRPESGTYANKRKGYGVTYLGKDRGYAMNYKPSRADPAAYRAAKKNFGEKVDVAMNTYRRSHVTLDRLMDGVFRYDHPSPPRPTDPAYFMALQSVREDLKVGQTKLIPYNLDAIPQREDFPNSKSPGLPYKLMGVTTKRDAIDKLNALEDTRRIQYDIQIGRKVYLPDSCIFGRAQLVKTEQDDKARMITGFPFSVYILEATFFYPLIDWLKLHEHSLPVAYGVEMALGGMTEINAMLCRHPDATYVVLDWRRFDANTPPWIIRDAFDILLELFDLSQIKDINGNTYGARERDQRRIWGTIVNYFINTPMRNSIGERYLVQGGVPSGSTFTNIIDTVINVIMCRYLFYHNTGSFPVEEQYLGDDSIIVSYGNVDLVKISDMGREVFGGEINLEKSYKTTVRDNVHFLGYLNHSGIPYKAQEFLIVSFIHPEHTRRSRLEAACSALGQMLSGFSEAFATIWYNIILDLQHEDEVHSHGNHFEVKDVVGQVKESYHRFRYLNVLGVMREKIAIPVPDCESQLIGSVMPSLVCRVKLKTKVYDYVGLYHRARLKYQV